MISRTEVEQAFRFILGREPESSAVVDGFVATIETVEELRRTFIASPEFAGQLAANASSVSLQPLDWGAIPVDVDVSPEDLRTMLRHVETSWEMLGNTEMYWSVLTHDQFLTANLAPNLDEFYRSGRLAAERLIQAAERCGVVLSKTMTCLELGCGTGRITVWLAEHFQRLLACDISQPHLQAAEAAARARGVGNVDFICTNSLDALAKLPQFDVFFSLIVLQHNPPPVIAMILRTILGKLNPGGIAYFQVPTYIFGYRFKVDEYLIYAETTKQMEMHVVPQKALFAIFRETGCEVLEVREDDWAGSVNVVSNSFLVRKRPA